MPEDLVLFYLKNDTTARIYASVTWAFWCLMKKLMEFERHIMKRNGAARLKGYVMQAACVLGELVWGPI